MKIKALIFHYPSCFAKRTSYCHQLLPELFDNIPEISVSTLLAKRTYWEKVTLLHAEYHRPTENTVPRRLFRHYYDIVKLDQSGLAQDTLQDINLLADVVKNKSIYFPTKRANYEEAVVGALRLYPSKEFINKLKLDAM